MEEAKKKARILGITTTKEGSHRRKCKSLTELLRDIRIKDASMARVLPEELVEIILSYKDDIDSHECFLEIERNIERIQQKPCSYFVEEAMQNIRGYIMNKNRKTEKVRRKLFVRHKIIENNFGRKLRRLFRNLIGNVCKYHRLRSESNLIHQLHFI